MSTSTNRDAAAMIDERIQVLFDDNDAYKAMTPTAKGRHQARAARVNLNEMGEVLKECASTDSPIRLTRLVLKIQELHERASVRLDAALELIPKDKPAS